MNQPPTIAEEGGSARWDWRVALVLWAVPLLVYTSLIGRWSLSGDEFYTYVDSAQPVRDLLAYEQKPLYYLICHLLLQWDLGLPLEVVVRLPAAIAGSLIGPAFYLLVPKKEYSTAALFAAVIAIANPWLFEMAQMARFYTLAFLFASISSISAYRWFLNPQRVGWLVLFVVFGVLATASHTPAAIVLPAGILAIALGTMSRNPRGAFAAARKYAPMAIVGGGIAVCGGVYFLRDAFEFWLGSDSGQFGNYTVPQILVALALFGGISGWAMAGLPLLRVPTTWSASDLFLATMVVLGIAPFLFLVPLGGGVASKYLLFGLPCMFILAAQHWDYIDQRLPSMGYRVGLGIAILAFNLPYLASIASDGDHYDYRGIARDLAALELDNPVILASSNQMFDLYFEPDLEIHEMGTFENGVPRELIEEKIGLAVDEQRPLVLVSREDRTELSPEDQAWLFSRFAMLRMIQSRRFDHRRFRMVIYEYRPGQHQSIYDGLPTRRATQVAITEDRPDPP